MTQVKNNVISISYKGEPEGDKTPIDSPQEKGIFNSRDGTSLYYETYGKGEPLVLCYGLLCRREHWRHQIQHFSKTHRVIVFDYRGHQFSGFPANDQNMTLEWCANDIADLLKHLEIKKAVFLGHSMGVPVLTQFAGKNPEVLKGLVFICGAVTNPFKDMFYTNRIDKVFLAASRLHDLSPYLMDLIWKKMSEKNRMNYLLTSRLGFNANRSEEQDVLNYMEGVNQTPFRIFNSLMKDYTQFDGKKILPLIRARTLVIAGGNDMVTPVSLQKEISKLLPESELLVIDEGSHNAHTDFPVRVNEAVERFLAELL